jgi:hypothetical protein
MVRIILVLMKHDLVIGKNIPCMVFHATVAVALVLTCGMTSFVTMKEDM